MGLKKEDEVRISAGARVRVKPRARTGAGARPGFFGASLPEPEPDLDFGAALTWVRCTHVKTGLVGQWQSVKVLLAEALTSEMVAQNFNDQLQDMRRRITESAGYLGTRLIERLTDVVERWRTERTATVHIGTTPVSYTHLTLPTICSV